jgi:putative ABC transport system substrate-binding protein
MRARRLAVIICVGLLGLGADVMAQPARLVKIGVLTESWGPTPGIVGFRDGLKELGYRENEHFVIGVRFTQGDESELPKAAQDLVRHGVDVIVTSHTSNAAMAARAATTRIPIVFIGGSDPVRLGLVKSFARPGGNMTGVADLDVEMASKRLEMFYQLVPSLKRVMLPYAATNEHTVPHLEAYRDTARRLGLTLVEKALRTEEEARAVITGLRKQDADGIIAPRFLSLNIPGLILDPGPKQPLPAMFQTAFFVERGGLASYEASPEGMGRQAARLVDRILKGARPADLPVEQPTKFEFALNLKTAAALGLTIPQSVLVRADRVIQ